MNTINFKKKSLMKNFKKALKAANHIQPGEMVRTSSGGNHKMVFPRNSKVTKFIDLIINEIIKNPIIHNNFSRKFLEENIIYVLEDLQLSINYRRKCIYKIKASVYSISSRLSFILTPIATLSVVLLNAIIQ